MENYEIFMDITKYITAIHVRLEDESQEVKDSVLMVIAGDMLHDVSAESRKIFLDNYEDLRNEVVDYLQ